ncbi:MAG: DUF7718 family protein [Thermomicrobiales bacterium]
MYLLTINPHGNYVRVRFATEAGRLFEFVVQYETTVEERDYPVVRYDTAHGRPHRVLLDWSGATIRRDPLPEHLSLSQALDLARRDILETWANYRADFLRRRL